MPTALSRRFGSSLEFGVWVLVCALMTFGFPKLLWLLLLVPALAALTWWSFRARRRAMAQFVGIRLLASLTVGLSRTRQRIRAALVLGGVALALFAVARPQWGFDVEEARQRGLDVVIAIDTSKSMLADDIRPNRLTRAKLAALDLMRLSRSDRLGLVAFAGSAFLQCPLSLDDEAFRQSVEALDVNIIPQGGTAVAEAIQTALSAFKEKTDNHRIVVLFTDGEDNEGESEALAAARAAKKEGLRVFTIGVGTPAGELLSTTDPYGNRVFIKDDKGNVVKSRLNQALLQQIAKETDGFYLPLSGAGTMEVLYERGLAPLPKSEFGTKTLRQQHERFQWFLGVAIVLLLAEMFFPERAKRKRTTPATAVVTALLCFATVNTFGAANDALKNYNHGRYSKAREEFEKLAKKNPDDARLRYNAGAAAFQDESFDDALRHFSASLSAPDVKLQEQSYYNLGNTRFRLGEHAKDAKEKQESWEQAIRDFDNALKLDPTDPDAKFNRDIVQQKIEELKKQQQQKQDKNDEQKKDEQKQDKQDQQKQENKSGDENKDKQENQKSEQQKKEEEQSKQQQQQDSQKQDKQDQSSQQQQQAQDQRGEQPDKASQAAQYNRVMQMTPQQAAQLLEAQKAEEKAMVFLPQQAARTNRQPNRVVKDW
jgi:Ca-activated chloride channel homolog